MFSLVFSCQWGSESVAFSVSSVSVAFRVCTVQWVIVRLYSSASAVFRALAVTKSLSCSCHVQSQHFEGPLPLRSSWILTSRQSQVTWGQNTMLKKKKKSPLIYQCTMTHFGTYLFSVGTHRGNLLVSSRFSTGALNFWVHSIPLWEPCVEKPVMLRASIHRPVGGAL